MGRGDDELEREMVEAERVFARDWMPRIRLRCPDAVQLSSDNPELIALLEAGLITMKQLEKALARGAVCYSPSLNTFIDLKPAAPGDVPDLPELS